MATIQIRDIPDDVHERLAQLARDAGQSLQAYMREQVVDIAMSSTVRADTLLRLESYLLENGGVGATAEEIVADVHSSRR